MVWSSDVIHLNVSFFFPWQNSQKIILSFQDCVSVFYLKNTKYFNNIFLSPILTFDLLSLQIFPTYWTHVANFLLSPWRIFCSSWAWVIGVQSNNSKLSIEVFCVLFLVWVCLVFLTDGVHRLQVVFSCME